MLDVLQDCELSVKSEHAHLIRRQALLTFGFYLSYCLGFVSSLYVVRGGTEHKIAWQVATEEQRLITGPQSTFAAGTVLICCRRG